MIQDIYPLIFVFFGGYMTTCTLTQYPRVDSLKNRQILVGKCCIYEYQKFYYFYIGCDGIEISAKLKNEIFYLICGHNNSTFSTFFFFFFDNNIFYFYKYSNLPHEWDSTKNEIESSKEKDVLIPISLSYFWKKKYNYWKKVQI